MTSGTRYVSAADEVDLTGTSPVQRAIERIRFFCKPGKSVCVAFSGGKDSQTVYHLCKEAGIDFWAQYSVTRFEPPELWRFVREQYPDVKIRRAYKRSLVDEIEANGLPCRFARWCCGAKHARIDGADLVLIGIRAEESPRRAHNWRMTGRKLDGSFYLCPIIDWTAEQVWSYLNSRGVPHCSLYDEGYKRIGCVCCPLVPPQMVAQSIRWPKTARMVRMGADRFVARMRKMGFVTKRGKPCADWCNADNPEEEFWNRWIRTGQTTTPIDEWNKKGKSKAPREECLFEGSGFSEHDGEEEEQ